MLDGINALMDIYSNFISNLFRMPLFGNISFGSFCVACLIMLVIVTVFVRKVL